MICNDRLIFIHAPKTGGSSVRAALKAAHPDMKMPGAFHCAFHSVSLPGPTRYAFGFMRNPWERMVSYYRFMCQKPAGANDHKIYKRNAVIGMGFKRWVLEGKFGSFIREAVGQHPYAESVHHIPQMWWLKGCNFIGDQGRLQEGFDHAMRQVGYAPVPLLGRRVNQTNGGDWRTEYDNELHDFVAVKFAEDIEMGGYEFDRDWKPTALAG